MCTRHQQCNSPSDSYRGNSGTKLPSCSMTRISTSFKLRVCFAHCARQSPSHIPVLTWLPRSEKNKDEAEAYGVIVNTATVKLIRGGKMLLHPEYPFLWAFSP